MMVGFYFLLLLLFFLSFFFFWELDKLHFCFSIFTICACFYYYSIILFFLLFHSFLNLFPKISNSSTVSSKKYLYSLFVFFYDFFFSVNQGSDAGSRFAKNLGFFDEGSWTGNNSGNNDIESAYSPKSDKKSEKSKKKVSFNFDTYEKKKFSFFIEIF